MTATATPEFLTAPELAEFLRVPLGTVRKWRHEGTGPRARRIGNHLRYRRTDVEAWLRTR